MKATKEKDVAFHLLQVGSNDTVHKLYKTRTKLWIWYDVTGVRFSKLINSRATRVARVDRGWIFYSSIPCGIIFFYIIVSSCCGEGWKSLKEKSVKLLNFNIDPARSGLITACISLCTHGSYSLQSNYELHSEDIALYIMLGWEPQKPELSWKICNCDIYILYHAICRTVYSIMFR